MNSSNHSKRIADKYDQNEQPHQTGKDNIDSVHSRMPCLPAYTARPILPQKMKIPPQNAYPKHTEASFIPSFSTKPKAPQNSNNNDMPSLADVKRDPQKVTPIKENPSSVNPTKANNPPTVYSDQWWMEYDEYLGNLLK